MKSQPNPSANRQPVGHSSLPITPEVAETLSPIRVLKGRGAVSNPAGRFEKLTRQALDDGWPTDAADGGLPEPATDIRTIPVRSAISYNRSPDIAFDRSLNPYRGCEHGCIYCYARPTHAFDGLSPGLDFETRIGVRTGMAAVLARELDAPGYRCETINIGSVTDPYQPAERQHRLTRELLRELVLRRHPFTIVTKGALIERDIDLIAPAARQGLAKCFISISTLDPSLARLWDARASAPWRRLRAVRALADANIPVGVIAAPIAPFINDHEIERLVEAAALAGAETIHYTILRLPGEVRPLFLAWLATHFPDRHDRVLARLRDLRGGQRLNDARFFSRMRGQGVWAELISRRFQRAARRHGLSRERATLRTDLFEPMGSQLSLL